MSFFTDLIIVIIDQCSTEVVDTRPSEWRLASNVLHQPRLNYVCQWNSQVTSVLRVPAQFTLYCVWPWCVSLFGCGHSALLIYCSFPHSVSWRRWLWWTYSVVSVIVALIWEFGAIMSDTPILDWTILFGVQCGELAGLDGCESPSLVV